MNKSLIPACLAAAVFVAVPAQAHHPTHPKHPAQAKGPKSDHTSKPSKPADSGNAEKPDCTPLKVGYNARGKLVEANLTQVAGNDTARRGDDRYDGTVKVDVTKANHRAPKGEQTFTLDNARVWFYDANRDRKADEPKAGDRVALHGRITKLRKGCDATGFTPAITVRHVRFRPAKVK
jgi:hypothetical protein